MAKISQARKALKAQQAAASSKPVKKAAAPKKD